MHTFWGKTRDATHTCIGLKDTHTCTRTADVEREYWRVVEGGDLLLRVEYGNDLDVVSHGSGFPTPQNAKEPSPEIKVDACMRVCVRYTLHVHTCNYVCVLMCVYVYVGRTKL
jgi:hypothetical protein